MVNVMSQEILSKLNTNHIEEISSSRNEPEWLKDYRKSSLSVYDNLPLETSPLYNKYTDAKLSERVDDKNAEEGQVG